MTTQVIHLRKAPETTTKALADFLQVPHSKVMAKVRNQTEGCSAAFITQSFHPSTYTDKQGRTQPLYLLTRDGFLFLVMCFNTERSRALMQVFLKQFNDAEEGLLSYGLHSRPFEIEDFLV
jgi:Rha family phage regulatory protein